MTSGEAWTFFLALVQAYAVGQWLWVPLAVDRVRRRRTHPTPLQDSDSVANVSVGGRRDTRPDPEE